jgi:hypothetical protein
VYRVFSYVMTAILSVGVTLVGEGAMRVSKTFTENVTQPTNGAFRDGLYMARLDIENHREPHLSIGRWSSDTDRASYIAGYRQAYTNVLSGGSGNCQDGSLRFQLAQNETYHSSTGCLPAGIP